MIHLWPEHADKIAHPWIVWFIYLFFFVKYIRGLKKVPVGDPGPRGHITPLHREKGELSPKDMRLGPGGLVKAYDLAW